MRSRFDKKNVKARKDEAGYALIWVQIVLIAGAMILVPLMLVMTAGQITDFDQASPYIDTGDTSAEVKLITGSDSWNLVYVILSFRTVPGTESGLFPVGIMTYSYESQ